MTTVAIKNIEKRYAFGATTEPWRLTDYLGGALHGGWEEPPPGAVHGFQKIKTRNNYVHNY